MRHGSTAGYNLHLSEVTGMNTRVWPMRSYHRRRPGKRCPGLLAAALLAMLLPLAGAGGQERGDSRTTERQLREVRAELQTIARERRRLEGQRGSAAVRLRQAEEQLGRSARELAETDAALLREEQALEALQRQKLELERDQASRRDRLAALLRAAYARGEATPLKLLLAQDRMSDAQRMLAYYRYIQRDQARQLEVLTRSMSALVETEAAIAGRRQALETLRGEQQARVAAMQRDRGQRAALVDDLAQRYQDRQQREKALGQDARALERLLAQLRAAAARAEAERRAAARRAAQQQQSAGRSTTTPTKVPPRVASTAPAPRVGGLGWPASGELLARFGGRLPDGRTSNGVLIGAAEGSQVSAVADGTVVFSEWMTGYGLILIVDHGNGYMSLYAHNESLLRDAGVRVTRGEAVARVGSSGGHGRPALYFELRRNGQPVDPASWLQRR